MATRAAAPPPPQKVEEEEEDDEHIKLCAACDVVVDHVRGVSGAPPTYCFQNPTEESSVWRCLMRSNAKLRQGRGCTDEQFLSARKAKQEKSPLAALSQASTLSVIPVEEQARAAVLSDPQLRDRFGVALVHRPGGGGVAVLAVRDKTTGLWWDPILAGTRLGSHLAPSADAEALCAAAIAAAKMHRHDGQASDAARTLLDATVQLLSSNPQRVLSWASLPLSSFAQLPCSLGDEGVYLDVGTTRVNVCSGAIKAIFYTLHQSPARACAAVLFLQALCKHLVAELESPLDKRWVPVFRSTTAMLRGMIKMLLERGGTPTPAAIGQTTTPTRPTPVSQRLKQRQHTPRQRRTKRKREEEEEELNAALSVAKTLATWPMAAPEATGPAHPSAAKRARHPPHVDTA